MPSARCVCRMHGAAGGAPKGNRNALKHGGFTAETLALKREIQALARMVSEAMRAMEQPDANRPAFARRVSCRTFSWRWPHACRPLGTPARARFHELAVH